MNNENIILLSGPFVAVDSTGREWTLTGIWIFDEGYGGIDVYVDLAESMGDEPLHEDAALVRQILARLRVLGYDGPDFGAGEPDLQDDRQIVLEAPESFSRFAASKGWRSLADDYPDDAASADDIAADVASHAVFAALMRRLHAK